MDLKQQATRHKQMAAAPSLSEAPLSAACLSIVTIVTNKAPKVNDPT